MAEPSASYRQHHDVEAPQVDAAAFRQGWRVRSRLDVLLDEGAIEPRDYEAAAAFRRDWEIAFSERTPALMTFRSPSIGRVGSGPVDRLAALARLRRIAEALGPFDCKILEQCCVLDLAWAAIGRAHQVADTTARRWTIAALRRLGELPAPERAARRLGEAGAASGDQGATSERRTPPRRVAAP
jgi:hypothetical protein